MILSFHPCFSADEQIILGSRSLQPDDLKLIRRAKAIIFPQAVKPELYQACRNSEARLFPDYAPRFQYPGKSGQSRLFRQFGLPCPQTIYWQSVAAFRAALSDPGSFPHALPFLLKANEIHEAEGIYLIEDKNSLSEACAKLARRQKTSPTGFVSQDLVSCGGNVLRAVIIGRRIITYWKRPCRKGARIITTVSRGALIDHHWRPELQQKALQKTADFRLKTGINLAALDFVFSLPDKDPDPLCLEINYYFGRRGLGGTLRYYRLLLHAIKDWLEEQGLESASIELA